MFNINISQLLIMCLLLISVSGANNIPKGAIGFPETEENPKLANKEHRKPVYLPAMCPSNELYYPGDQKDDWICDCRPAHIYHPPSDKCWLAYQRGPCLEGQYLVLPSDSVIPVCENNPCNVDGYVIYNNVCVRMGTTNPCTDLFPVVAAVGVNATSLVISCVRLNLESRFGDTEPSITLPQNHCPLGCRRSVTGKCVANA